MRRRPLTVVSLAAAIGLLAVPLTASAATGSGHGRLQIVGLASAGTELVSFDPNRARSARSIGSVSGLVGDTKLVGIDYRVQDGLLYGVGDAGGVYTLAERTAVATKVAQLTVALQGTSFGVDFNPAANALRVVSDTGQNLRHPFAGPTAGTTVADTPLTYPPTAATGISAAAYTNNDLDAATATTLFDIDTTLDQVAIQSPANSGTLAPTGKLGVDAGADAGFDIATTTEDGVAVANTGFATLSVGGSYHLYEVDLLTGAVTDRGTFRSAVTDLAVAIR